MSDSNENSSAVNTKRKRENDDLLDDQNEKNLELEESYVTMVDVLNEEQKLEEDAYAVLGASDDKNCTYEDGYINRQALYSCRTCMGDNPKEEDIFGICLACSYACHEKHDLFELYTKRSFRCDCGTKKMKTNCTLDLKDKESVNEKNRYNHNFVGNYCICDKPYPNPEATNDEEMVQCIVCEDWYHATCLECEFPSDEDYAEMICKSCMNSNQFLWNYQTDKVKVKHEETKEQLDVIGSDKQDENNQIKKEDEIKNDLEKVQLDKEEKPLDVKPTIDAVATESNECKLKSLRLVKSIENKVGTTFWDEGWRSQLCKCDDCLSLYASKNVEFLTNENDTVHYYEAKGKENYQKMSQYERGLDEITKIDRVVGIEAITEYNKMSNEFKEHFRKFAENKKVIGQKDIEEFFATLKYKKRMKSSDSF